MDQIFVIDDDSISNFLVEKLLLKLKFCKEVKIFTNGLEAYRHLLVSEKLPSLIFLDIDMPVMDGYEFINQLKKSGLDKKIPVLVFTNFNREEEKLSLLGDFKVVQKPLTLEKMQLLFPATAF
ncbi:response regulator [Sporocytophaga myxococcoides]|uniref:response regulator n=1 Tax=Sporocytophaga myxococcoides TaxID=153721 RepID=UPI00041CFE32|nr:response regulator [Sporocytophaga myxococcoides]